MIDSHIHLSDKRFDADRDDVILRSVEMGVRYFLEVLTSPCEWERWRFFEGYNEFYFSFGIHPHEAERYSHNDLQKIADYLALKNSIAVGETGVDLWYYEEKLNKQLELFEIMLNIAYRYSKPLILHIRNSKDGKSGYKIVYEFLKPRKNLITKGGIVHSFSGLADEAKLFVDSGFLIGINATITYPKNHNLHQTVKLLPLNSLLTETDSPYLPPQDIRGKRNDPRSIRYIVEAIAAIKGLEKDIVEKTIDENFLRFLAQSS